MRVCLRPDQRYLQSAPSLASIIVMSSSYRLSHLPIPPAVCHCPSKIPKLSLELAACDRTTPSTFQRGWELIPGVLFAARAGQQTQVAMAADEIARYTSSSCVESTAFLEGGQVALSDAQQLLSSFCRFSTVNLVLRQHVSVGPTSSSAQPSPSSLNQYIESRPADGEAELTEVHSTGVRHEEDNGLLTSLMTTKLSVRRRLPAPPHSATSLACPGAVVHNGMACKRANIPWTLGSGRWYSSQLYVAPCSGAKPGADRAVSAEQKLTVSVNGQGWRRVKGRVLLSRESSR